MRGLEDGASPRRARRRARRPCRARGPQWASTFPAVMRSTMPVVEWPGR
ncbi:hypothetical protein ACFFX0_04325 [Citricoccus parietis]|uniref:Uncharacterized protein n=1 Tax=Citricoccus parietis TaxID=592307 RepID=A0ABV5FUW7_9MICC